MGQAGGKTKENLECWDSSENIRLPLTAHSNHTSISDQHFAGNSELYPIWRHSFRSWHLAGNSFLVKYHVNMNQVMNGRTVAANKARGVRFSASPDAWEKVNSYYMVAPWADELYRILCYNWLVELARRKSTQDYPICPTRKKKKQWINC